MSKQKKVRKIVLDKLFYKNQSLMKKSTRSNAPTQSTPNEPKNSYKFIQKFFQNFQVECAIIYQPVKLIDVKPLKRSLEQQLSFLAKSDKKLKFKTQQPQINDIFSTKPNDEELKFNKKKNQNYSRVHTSTGYSRSRQKVKQSTGVINSKFYQNKSSLVQVISPEHSKILSKESSLQFLPKQISPSFGLQKSRPAKGIRMSIQKQNPRQKYVSIKKNNQNINQNQHFKSNNQLMSQKNSQYNCQKYNAPKKAVGISQGQEKVKRIQSLRNLNQNGVRKYYYKNDL